jgi:hypothetical protein
MFITRGGTNEKDMDVLIVNALTNGALDAGITGACG